MSGGRRVRACLGVCRDTSGRRAGIGYDAERGRERERRGEGLGHVLTFEFCTLVYTTYTYACIHRRGEGGGRGEGGKEGGREGGR